VSRTITGLVIIPEERRRKRGWMNDRSENAEKTTGVITVTAAKLVGGLIGLISAVLLVTTWAFSQIVESKLTAVGLLYATKQEAVPRAEFEIRRTELAEQDKRTNDRITELERRIKELEDQQRKPR
jgi:BMFP domain-containing protein YqiC